MEHMRKQLLNLWLSAPWPPRPGLRLAGLGFLLSMMASCGDTQGAGAAEGVAEDGPAVSAQREARVQSYRIEHGGTVHSGRLLCTPVVFPEERIGTDGILEGGSPGHVRSARAGYWPTPQFIALPTDRDTLLVRLACSGQWTRAGELGTDVPVADAVEAFRATLAPGLDPVLEPLEDIAFTVSDPEGAASDADFAKARETVADLLPFRSLLRAYRRDTVRTEPLRAVGGDVLPGRGDPAYDRMRTLPVCSGGVVPESPELRRRCSSPPWRITCNGSAPSKTAKPGGAEVSGYTVAGQTVLAYAPALPDCRLMGVMDLQDVDYDDRPTSPYPADVLHLVTDGGESVYLRSALLDVRDRFLMFHLPEEGQGRTGEGRDAYLDTRAFREGLAESLSAFAQD